MPFPPEIPTRIVSVGGAMVLESADLLKVRVTITGSRSLIWADSGYRFENLKVSATSELGSEVQIQLPRTDVAGWKDAKTGAVIDVSEPDSYSHRYTALVEFLDDTGTAVGVQPVTIGPFVLPEGDGSVVDLDKTVPASSTAGDAVSVPDWWSTQVAAAEAAALAAQAALIDSAQFVADEISTEGTPANIALSATIAEVAA